MGRKNVSFKYTERYLVCNQDVEISSSFSFSVPHYTWLRFILLSMNEKIHLHFSSSNLVKLSVQYIKKKKTKNIRRVSNGNEFSFCVLDIIFFSSFVLEAKTFLINLFLLPKTGNFFFNFININHFSGGSLNAHERKPPKKKYCIWHGRKSKWNTAELFITKRKMS